MMKIEITEKSRDRLVRECLKDTLQYCHADDAALERALHVVIAYYSVPGSYMEGAYDGEGVEE